MVQIRVGDIILDLYQFDPPKLNFNIEDITDTAAKSEFTRTFRIPATPNNNEFFETAFEINGQDFDVTVKIPAKLYVDGNLFRDGELRLNNIYITRENEKIDYECVFFGNVRNLVSSIGEGTLNQLNLSAYDHTLTTQIIVDSWQAYPEGSTTDGLLNGDVLYPLIDFGNTYNGDGDVVEGEISPLQGTGRLPFTEQNHALDRERFKPMIRVKAVWDAIFEEAGFTYTSNFLSGNTFLKLYIGAFGNNASIFTQGLSNIVRAEESGIGGGGELELSPTPNGYDPGNNMLNGRYIVPETGSYQFNYRLAGSGFNDGPVNITLRLRNGGTTLDSVSITTGGDFSDPSFSFSISQTFTTSLTAGDEINLFFDSDEQIEFDGRLTILDAPGSQSIAPLLSNKYKKIDFVRDVITKFRLVVAPDKNDSSNLIIEPWQQYIANGDTFDWTKKLDVSKDVKIMPLFYTQKSKITFTDSEGGDEFNEIYQDEFDEVFGTLNVFINNELLKDNREVKTNIIPSPVSQVRGAEQANAQLDNTIIPHLYTIDPVDTGAQYLPVLAENRFMFYNGIKDGNTPPYTSNDWFIEDDAAGTTGFTNYPMVSPYSDFPVSATTLDISWQREEGFIKFDYQDPNVGSSVYDRYWSLYINSLYDKWARRVTAYFVLNAEDLINFSYDDVIFVKDAYYYVEKIYDVPMGEKASVKVDLIKLINYDELEVERPRSLCIVDENNTYYNGTYYPMDTFVVGENLTNIATDRYTIDLTSTASTFYDTYSATTSASTKAFLFYEKSNEPIYNWYIYEYVSGTPTSGNTLTIDASNGIVSGSTSTFKTDAFVPDAATDGDCDCSVTGDVPCEDVQTIRLRRVDGTLQEQNACFRSTGINAYLEWVSQTGATTCETTYTVNCTGSTEYEIWTGTNKNNETVVLYNTNEFGSSLDVFHTEVLVSGTIACGNNIVLRSVNDSPTSCVHNSWCFYDGAYQYCTRPDGVKIPSVCGCPPPDGSQIEIRYNVC